jgi:hypothetical protein
LSDVNPAVVRPLVAHRGEPGFDVDGRAR